MKLLFTLYLIIHYVSSSSPSSSVIVETITGDHEDTCGIYPPCQQFGPGTWQILEDCNKYIICTLQGDGTYLQQNMRCPGDLFYDEEHEDCVEESFICRNFQSIPCLNSCPRIMLSSTGPALQYKERLLGCFRLKGQKVGNTLVYYQNMNKFYLTPDAFSTPFIKHWLISELRNPTSGGIKNLLYDYLQCPYDGWNEGWEVDSGNGNWVDDLSVVTTCYKGEEGMSTTSSPTTTTTNYGVHSAMIITGGYNVQTEKPAEVFDVSTGQHCTLPQLPEGRVWHSQVRFTHLKLILFLALLNIRMGNFYVEEQYMKQHVFV